MMPARYRKIATMTVFAWVAAAAMAATGVAQDEAPPAPALLPVPPVDGPVTLPPDAEHGDRPNAPDEAQDAAPAMSAEPSPSPANRADEAAADRAADQKPAASEQPKAAPDANDAAQPQPLAAPRRELTASAAALRNQVRRTLTAMHRQALSTEANTPNEIMQACMAFGCQTEIVRGSQRVNGIAALCWNYGCAGFEPLMICQGHVAARVGFGQQERPGQLLAALALARVPANYPMRVREEVRDVADLVKYEKLACRSGSDLSLALVGLSFYVDDPAWKNDLGEEWTIERMVGEELAKPIVAAPDGGMARLMGLGCALECRLQRQQPLEGQFARAAKFVGDLHNFALGIQNADGSWGPQFLAARGTGRDPVAQLRSCGRIVEWLAWSLPDERLDDARMLKAVEYVNNLLAAQRYQNTLRGLTTRELTSVMHALHGLYVFDERYFAPADPPPVEKQPAKAATAARPARGG